MRLTKSHIHKEKEDRKIERRLIPTNIYRAGERETDIHREDQRHRQDVYKARVRERLK